jgi:hypothetical protein
MRPTLALEAFMNHELYADSAQARALDRRMAGDDTPWAEGITSKQAKANNQAWLDMLARSDKAQRASSRKAISGALDKMEAMCGSGAARRTA